LPEALPEVPLLACAPFVALLLCIAVLPLAAPKWWHRPSSQALVAGSLGGAAAIWCLLRLGPAALLESMHHYLAFIIMLGALYVISGGLLLEGELPATPAVNASFLLLGSLLASFIGTTGASMLLIRPLLRVNRERKHVVHTVVFFIFLVSNIGGCLTPLGDPPLYVGYLEGVPFRWTLGLWPEWAFMVGSLLAIYLVLELRFARREPAGPAPRARTSLRLRGRINLALLLAAVLTVALVKEPQVPHAGVVRDVALVLLALLSLNATPRGVHAANEFAWDPLVEVTVLFAGIFAAMTPALILLQQHGASLGLNKPWHFFWATGALSSVLDNAPAYLAFGSAATGLLHAVAPELNLASGQIGGLVAIDPATHAELARLGHDLLVAVSLGAVFAGASTYIANGPNFMVKAIAESRGVKMPGFAGYCVWSLLIVLPLLGILTLVFMT
jgi:Na+/H+ antiporter NhaD/arsenite permease-like protein